MARDAAGHFRDLFAPLDNVVFRRMFGGLGIFRDGVMFALVDDGVLYMKADEVTASAYAAEGSGQFIFAGMRGRAVPMPYWRVPDRLLDEPQEFAAWALRAFAVAQRTQKPKSGNRSRSRRPA
jgi:DNA transformation protein